MVVILDKKWVFNSDKSESALAEEFNKFYLRFDSYDFTNEPSEFRVVSEGSQVLVNGLTVPAANYLKTELCF